MEDKNLIERRDGSIGYYMGRTHRTLENRINKLFLEHQIDLSMEHWIVLMNLWIEDGISQQSLAERIFKDKASVTRVLSLMEKRSLLVRIPDQNDKRVKRVHLTHFGRALKDQTLPMMEKSMECAMKGISEKDIQVCMNVLDQIYLNMTNTEEKRLQMQPGKLD